MAGRTPAEPNKDRAMVSGAKGPPPRTLAPIVKTTKNVPVASTGDGARGMRSYLSLGKN
jgi:hypothetical protein